MRLHRQGQARRRQGCRRSSTHDRGLGCGLHGVLRAPFTLPAIVLAGAGSLIAVLDHAHGLMTILSIAVVIGAWIWIAWRARTTGSRIRSSVLALMGAATILTATAALWPVMEPAVFHALGVAKKPRPPAS